jgi:hypothetical protein
MKIECIDKSFNASAAKKAHTLLQQRFMFTISDLKAGKKNFEASTLSKINAPESPKQVIAEKDNICEICHEDYYNPEALAMHYALEHKDDKNDNSDDDL